MALDYPMLGPLVTSWKENNGPNSPDFEDFFSKIASFL
jgi:hypothetical protein